MSITFRIATSADDQHQTTATITAPQLAALRALLRAESARTGIDLLEPSGDGDDRPPCQFEARVCPLALATFAKIFDYETDAIEVIDDAQFRGRRISVFRGGPAASIRMRTSLTSDLGVELNLANGNAHTLLESIGLRPDSVGEIEVSAIRDRLANPVIRRRVAEEGLTRYVDRLDRLLATADTDETSRLEWA